jgi:hypothetical protein
MAQPLRMQVSGAWFYVIGRGNEQRARSIGTGWFSRRQRRAGHLVRGRFQSVTLEATAPAVS